MTRLARLTEAMVRDRQSELERIHPAVLAASAEELLAAGNGDFERWRIPANWRDAEARQKYCSGCRRWLDVAAFRKRAMSKDGLQTQCGECGAARNKGRRTSAKRAQGRKRR